MTTTTTTKRPDLRTYLALADAYDAFRGVDRFTTSAIRAEMAARLFEAWVAAERPQAGLQAAEAAVLVECRLRLQPIAGSAEDEKRIRALADHAAIAFALAAVAYVRAGNADEERDAQLALGDHDTDAPPAPVEPPDLGEIPAAAAVPAEAHSTRFLEMVDGHSF